MSPTTPPARRDRPRSSTQRTRKLVKLPHPPRPYDLDLLAPFLTARGRIKSRRQTGLSARQQRQVARAVKQARELALLPYVRDGARGAAGIRPGRERV